MNKGYRKKSHVCNCNTQKLKEEGGEPDYCHCRKSLSLSQICKCVGLEIYPVSLKAHW